MTKLNNLIRQVYTPKWFPQTKLSKIILFLFFNPSKLLFHVPNQIFFKLGINFLLTFDKKKITIKKLQVTIKLLH